jgi:hypothetical protein
MANVSIINGFRPVDPKTGAAFSGSYRRYYKGTTAGILGVGDPVIRLTASSDPQGGSEIVRATTAAAITGVIVGFAFDKTNLHKSGYMLAADTGYVWVADDPYLWFEVQEDSVGATIAIANIGNYVNSVAAINANTTLGNSNYQIASNSLGTSTGTWRLERLVNRPNNAVGANAKWLVSPALHTEINNSALNLTAV